ncbi:uncharacterized protein LOC122499037 [Leptopilina heterotoma]|uniref:uncharacterized protein LOC122499037 n=1 Tax=Leptopilina heterotoma TaxID=63436 RepID=UPI001CA897B7|nr:uncharacterized protein LOC122499037 [Leptopilina heterotoma]
MGQRILQKFIMNLVVITTVASSMSVERRGRHIATLADSSQWTNSTKQQKDSVSSDRVSAKRDKDDTLWNDGILMSSAGNGKEQKSSSDDDDEKKTLSQQVKEGKYGLIQSELYPREPKRPGIISYLPNSEVPKDTVKNLGGLDKDEIWMAENHILVLRGGSFPKDDPASRNSETPWPPIDDYEAPRRQVKIPKDPKVPPPFPIQLSDGGSIQIIGNNGTGSRDNGTMDYEYLSGSKGYLPGEGPFFSVPTGDSLASPGFIKSVNDTQGSIAEKKGKSEPPFDVLPPFFPSLPPGAVFVPPPSNMSDYDEDDQSIFYPPPYSFVFPQDNTTAIPPGPLVPGIILPPPPDFFSTLEEKKTSAKGKPSRLTTPAPKSRTTYFTSRKTGTKLYKTTATPTTQSPIRIGTLPVTSKPTGKIKLKSVTHKPFFLEITTPIAETSSQLEKTKSAFGNTKSVFHNTKSTYENTIDARTEKNPWSSVISKSVPLTYYATTSPSSVDQPVEATPATIKSIITTKNSGRVPSKASYYFYEEATEEPSTMKPPMYRTTTVIPFLKSENPEQDRKNNYYKVEMLPARQTTTDISVKLIDSILKDPQVFQYTEADPPNEKENLPPNSGPIFFESVPGRSLDLNSYYTTMKPKSSLDLNSYYTTQKPKSSLDMNYYTTQKPKSALEMNSYYTTQKPKSSLDMNSYYTTPKPQNYYREDTSIEERKPKPIYQYSFEAAGYSKRDKQKQDLASYNEFQDIQTVSDQYDYDGSESLPEEQIRTERIPSDRAPLERIPSDRSPFNPPNTIPDRSPSNTISADRNRLERIPSHRIPYKTQSIYQTTISPFIDSTMDPHQSYFTKQDEQLLDDVTKEYFTAFGKKLTSRGQSTTPIYGKSSTVTEKPKYSTYVPNHYDFRQLKTKVKVHYGDQSQGPFSLKGDTLVNYQHPLPINPDSEPIEKPVSLKNDILVNYRNPLPPINPDSEFINVNSQTVPREFQDFIPVENQVRAYRPQGIRAQSGFTPIRNYGDQRLQRIRGEGGFLPIANWNKYPRPVSLQGDIAVNYRNPRPPINPDAEFITPVQNSETVKANSYIEYSLPGGQVYFFPPQANPTRQDDRESVFAKPRTSRFLRRRRGPGTNV